jgi:type II secretory pathway predicted ATPase ExeA/peptidoglycan hydrolase-like protein with peptidoglycan-binding domain
MYAAYFSLSEPPFSITPDPRFVYLSSRHREALAHLQYSLSGQNGFVLLTGEVGTGKTTLCRCILESTPEELDIALILNPALDARELVASICDELGVEYDAHADGVRAIYKALNEHLLAQHNEGRRVVVIIDEAQNLGAEVLEQVRLLTNLETSKQKLLQIVLIGQPELRDLVAQQNLRQLAQRITARYHLMPLDASDTAAYIEHRLSVCGANRPLFTARALRRVHEHATGIPRLVNTICDRALLGAYATGKRQVTPAIVDNAAVEVLNRPRRRRWLLPLAGATAAGAALSVGAMVATGNLSLDFLWAEFSQMASVAKLETSAATPSGQKRVTVQQTTTRQSASLTAAVVAPAPLPLVPADTAVTATPTAPAAAKSVAGASGLNDLALGGLELGDSESDTGESDSSGVVADKGPPVEVASRALTVAEQLAGAASNYSGVVASDSNAASAPAGAASASAPVGNRTLDGQLGKEPPGNGRPGNGLTTTEQTAVAESPSLTGGAAVASAGSTSDARVGSTSPGAALGARLAGVVTPATRAQAKSTEFASADLSSGNEADQAALSLAPLTSTVRQPDPKREHRPATSPPTNMTETAPRRGIPAIALLHANAEQAYASMFRRWGLDYAALPGENVCERAEWANLRCHSGRGSFDEVMSLDRPMVLTLPGDGIPNAYAAVMGRTEGGVVLGHGAGRGELPRARLDAMWKGDFLMLWRAPPGFPQTHVAQGATGKYVDWLSTSLARVQGLPVAATTSPGAAVFDAALTERVRAFQRANGLAVDGVVGKHTTMAINNVVLAGRIPRLAE